MVDVNLHNGCHLLLLLFTLVGKLHFPEHKGRAQMLIS